MFLLLLFVTALTLVDVSAIPLQLHELGLKDTQTQRCGAANGGFSCLTSGALNTCCSQYGWCGDTSDHCGTGCQCAYGRCGDRAPTPPGEAPHSRLGSVPYGVGIYTCSIPGVIALTYDDGPYAWTSQLLDTLDSYGVKATFFITANNLEKGSLDDPNLPWAALLQRMYASGHQIASHTMDHLDLDVLSESDRQLQMTRFETVMKGILGRYPTYMRPPYSSCSSTCLATLNFLGYHCIFWDLNTDDYNNATPSLIQKSKDIVSIAISGADRRYRGFISIAHDIHYQTVFNLTLHEITAGLNAGFRFVTLGECLNDPPSNWYRTEL